jgi:predicted  nucleic acid-binding Zn-ribbon protein
MYMDAEILGARLSATEAALLKIDERLDELAGKVETWTTQQLSNSEANTQIAKLAAEVAIAEAEARTAEAEAVEAMAEAQEAEAEARQLEALDLQPEPEPEPEPEVALEVIEAPEPEEPKEETAPSSSRRSDLEDLGLR